MLIIQIIILSLAALAGGFFIADVVEYWQTKEKQKENDHEKE